MRIKIQDKGEESNMDKLSWIKKTIKFIFGIEAKRIMRADATIEVIKTVTFEKAFLFKGRHTCICTFIRLNILKIKRDIRFLCRLTFCIGQFRG